MQNEKGRADSALPFPYPGLPPDITPALSM